MKQSKLIFFFLLLIPLALADDTMVLHIGDSHTVGTYGENLHSLLRGIPQTQVRTYGIGGASSSTWLTGYNPSLPEREDKSRFISETGSITTPILGSQVSFNMLQSEFNFDIVIISLGTNMVASAQTDSGLRSTKAQAITLARLAHQGGDQESKCYWIGPPLATKICAKWEQAECTRYLESQELTQALEKTVIAIQEGAQQEGCTFIDARPLSPIDLISKSDGVHYPSQRAGATLALAVFDQMNIGEEEQLPPDFAEDSDSSSQEQNNPLSPSSSTSPASRQQTSGQASISSNSASLISCRSQQSCQEIDEVWFQKLGSIIRQSRLVWNQQENRYVEWLSLYPQPQVPSHTLPPEPEASFQTARDDPIPSSEVDKLFIAAAKNQNFPPELLKAISWYESGINNRVLGPAGDLGYFQFTLSTAKKYFPSGKLNKCCTLDDDEKNTGCTKEIAAHGNRWSYDLFNEGVFLCSPENDERFDAQKEIPAGARLVSDNLAALSDINFASPEEKYKVAIASHHLGSTPNWVKRYIQEGKIDPQTPLTWDLVRDTIFKDKGCYTSKHKRYDEGMDWYVTTIFDCSQTYNQEGMGARCTKEKREFTRC